MIFFPQGFDIMEGFNEAGGSVFKLVS